MRGALRRSHPTDSRSPETPNTLRRRIVQAFSAVTLLQITRPGYAAEVVAVRVWPARDYTRITIEHDNALKITQFTASNPPRLGIDIEGIQLNEALRGLIGKIQANDPHVLGVRVGQNRPKVVRLVFDLKGDVAPQVFQLAPVAQYQHRLVLDLYPAQAPDPLLALIEQQGREPLQLKPSDQIATGETRSEGNKSAAGFTSPEDKPARTEANDAEARSKSNSKSEARTERPSGERNALAKNETTPESAGKATANSSRTPSVSRMITVAIDPGHGGEDPGAVGPSGTYEKTVVLQIAKRLKSLIDQEPAMRAMLTRDDDFFVPLVQRVEKARRVEADLFVSVHADAFTNQSARGSSVFVLSEGGATSTTARWLAKSQNDADLIGGVNLGRHEISVARTLLDMSTSAQIKDSLKLGSAVLSEIGDINSLHKPRVEQASFAVLKAPDIPSILVETAFISNPDEEARLRSSSHQDRIARAILGGIKRYFAKNPPLAKNRMAML